MERKLAKHIVRETFRTGRTLEELLHLLKEHCEEGEYGEYRMAIATAIHRIQSELLTRAFAAHPGLQEEIELDIGTYGRVL
jgi:hypothetical protein